MQPKAQQWKGLKDNDAWQKGCLRSCTTRNTHPEFIRGWAIEKGARSGLSRQIQLRTNQPDAIANLINAKRDRIALESVRVDAVVLQPALSSKDRVAFLWRVTPRRLDRYE